jgi:glycine/D-amino acid oxidase-like deaminating enzyme
LPALAGDRDADVVIVGAGYTGLWAAWHVAALAPDARVVVLEAGRAGHGPSGRNGGFCNTVWHHLRVIRERFGDAAALEIGHAAAASVAAIGRFCEQQGIDAWFRPSGYMEVSTAPVADAVVAQAVAEAGKAGESEAVIALTPGQVAARCRSPVFRGGTFYPQAATVQPARLAFGLREAVRGHGVELYEQTPVKRVRARGGGIEVETPSGTVRAPRAVVAIGPAAGARGWQAHNRLTIASSHMVLTEPVPDLLETVGWTGGECITDARALIHYFRTTPDGRIAFGWGGGQIAFGANVGGRAELDPRVVAEAARHLVAIFPGMEGRRIERAWGGPIDASPSHLPVIRPSAGGRILTAFGYTGNGVGPSHLIGRGLASLALERRDEASRLAFVDPSPHAVPPEPARWIGAAAIRAALVRRERAEAEGRKPDPLTRAVSAIPGKIGFHIGR